MSKAFRLAGAIAVGMYGLAAAAQAGPIVYDDFGPTTVTDEYWGANNNFNGNTQYGDILANDVAQANLDASSKFSIFGMDVSKVGNDLIVYVTTNFAAGIGVNNVNSAALNTVMGALFIGNGTPAYNAAGTGLTFGGVGAPEYDLDIYTADKARFDYAFVPSLVGVGELATTAHSAALKPLDQTVGGLGTDVQLSWTGNTSNTNDGGIRTQQAVGYKGNAASIATGEWQVVTGGTQIKFTIDDFFLLPLFYDNLQTALTLAWAMSCANDVAYATVGLVGRAVPDVPLPAGLVLLLSGLAGMGFLGRYKAKLMRSAA